LKFLKRGIVIHGGDDVRVRRDVGWKEVEVKIWNLERLMGHGGGWPFSDGETERGRQFLVAKGSFYHCPIVHRGTEVG